MALVELFVSKDKFSDGINRIDVQLNRLYQIRGEYQSLITKLDQQVVGEQATAYEKLKSNAMQMLDNLDVQIQYALACKGSLQKTVDEMDENQTLMEGILDDSGNIIKNTIEATKDAAKTASAAAKIASIL